MKSNSKTNKILIILLVIIIAIITIYPSNKTYATEISLEQIVEKINNSKTAAYYKKYGTTIKATNNTNSLTITCENEYDNYSSVYNLEGSVLSIILDAATETKSTTDENENTTTVKTYNFNGETFHKTIETEEDSDIINQFTLMCLVDAVGQLHGYKEGETNSTYNSEQIEEYTLEEEGFEIERIDETNYKVQIDINKKMPLADFSNTYIEVSDLEFYSKDMIRKSSILFGSGNVSLYKTENDGVSTILIGEKGGLTKNSYNSMLSIIELLFDSNEFLNNFKNNYPDLSIGNKEFRGFKVELNPIKNQDEEERLKMYFECSDCYEDYKFLRLTIDKNLLLGITDEDDTYTTEDITTMPDTGETSNIVIALKCINVTSVIILILLLIYYNKTKKHNFEV